MKRHRRKFVAGGVIIGGAAAAITLLDRHISQVYIDTYFRQADRHTNTQIYTHRQTNLQTD